MSLETRIWWKIGLIFIVGVGIFGAYLFVYDPHSRMPFIERATLGFVAGLFLGATAFLFASVPWGFLRILGWAFDPPRGLQDQYSGQQAGTRRDRDSTG